MIADRPIDTAVSAIASAIGEPARARILYCLLDRRARTSTELSVIAGVSPSTTSVHLDRLKAAQLVAVQAQGKHHFFSLAGPDVARALESLSVLAGGTHDRFVPRTPVRLRLARTCYDHMAGTIGVQLHDRLKTLGWLSAGSKGRERSYELTADGAKAFQSLGIDVDALRVLRRRFAGPCLDWSERRSHLGGALGAALLSLALKKRWVTQDLDSRALSLTAHGRREVLSEFGLRLSEPPPVSPRRHSPV